MLFSIIIPVYNRADIVQRTLDTVVAQTYRPLQLVLVDNCSTDDSLAVLQRFAGEHNAPDCNVVVTQEQHHTAGAARNRGLQYATGQWLMFFDSDDEMTPNLVSDYARIVERERERVDLISTTSLLKFPDGTSRRAPFFTSDILANHLLHSQLATQRYAVRREFFTATGCWDASLPVWNDWEMGVRLLLAKPRIAYMGGDSRVLIHHNGKDSITGTEFHTRAGQWEHVFEQIEADFHEVSLPNVMRYTRLLHYRRLVLAAQYEREQCHEMAQPLFDEAYETLRNSYDNNHQWRWVIAPIVRCLYRRIVAGKRGSARIARRLF